jgi:uncharacterized protein (TIGR02001 family)
MEGARLRLRMVVVNFRHCLVHVCAVLGLLAAGPLDAHEFHGYLTLVSDYVFRGASQSNEDPTVQGGLDYRHPGGVFAGVFAAHIDYPENDFGSNPGSVEFDAYVGYSRTIARDWSWDVAVLRYDFPDSTGIDYSYAELAANLHFRDVLRVGVTASDDAGASRDGGWTAEIEMRRSFGDGYQLSGSLGYYGFGRADWDDYAYWDLGVSAVAGAFTFDLRYFDMDGDEAGFAGPELTGSRLVGSVSVGF